MPTPSKYSIDFIQIVMKIIYGSVLALIILSASPFRLSLTILL